MKNQELMLTALFIVLGAVLVTGLVAIPVIEEANAALCKTKDGITTCKDKKPKKHNWAITSSNLLPSFLCFILVH